jgi:hypothetical protein
MQSEPAGQQSPPQGVVLPGQLPAGDGVVVQVPAVHWLDGQHAAPQGVVPDGQQPEAPQLWPPAQQPPLQGTGQVAATAVAKQVPLVPGTVVLQAYPE